MEGIIKKHKIIFIAIILVVSVYAYSKITSLYVLKEVALTINSSEIFDLKFEELDDYLKEKGYLVENIFDTEYNSENIIAKKGNEIIEVQKMINGFTIDYVFLNSNIDMTPLIFDLNWEDTFSKAKFKIGLNWFNTRFNSLHPTLSTSIHMGQDWILITANENVRYSYDLDFDSSKKLYKVQVSKYDY